MYSAIIAQFWFFGVSKKTLHGITIIFLTSDNVGAAAAIREVRRLLRYEELDADRQYYRVKASTKHVLRRRNANVALRVACSTVDSSNGRCATACSKKPRAIGRFAVQQWNYRASVPLGRHSARGGSVDTGLVGLQPLKIRPTNRELCLTGGREACPPPFLSGRLRIVPKIFAKFPCVFDPLRTTQQKLMLNWDKIAVYILSLNWAYWF